MKLRNDPVGILLVLLFAAAVTLFAVSLAPAQTPVLGATCFPRVAHLAAKLSVRPSDANDAPTIMVAACNGKNYDLLKMIDALLSKMDNSAPRASSTNKYSK